jgi:hypothetical protein
VSIGVLIGLPCNILNELWVLRDIGSKNLPVKTCILNSDFSIELLHEMFSNCAGASEESLINWSFLEDILSGRSIRVEQTQIRFRETAVVQKSYELFKCHTCSDIWLDKHFVSHEEGTHHL